MAFPLLEGLGMADAATYTPPGGGDATACTVILNLSVERVPAGFSGARRDSLTFRHAEVTPAYGGVVVIGSDSYTLGDRDRRDESGSTWWLQN